MNTSFSKKVTLLIGDYEKDSIFFFKYNSVDVQSIKARSQEPYHIENTIILC